MMLDDMSFTDYLVAEYDLKERQRKEQMEKAEFEKYAKEHNIFYCAKELQEPCEDCDYSEIMDWEQDEKTGKAKPIYWCERHKEPCDDAVSRQAVLNILQDYVFEADEIESVTDECQNDMAESIARDIVQLPPVRPQEPCELLIIKSDILLHQDDKKKWVESIKREKESGVIILPPYFEPLLVPNDIEISIEQEPQESEG